MRRGRHSMPGGSTQAGLAVVMAFLVLAVAPFAATRVVADSSPLDASFFMVIIFAALLTAFLLLHRFLAEGDLRLLALAATYLFTGFTFSARQLVVPGVLRADSVIHAPLATGKWLWIIAHGAFPLAIAVSMMLPRRSQDPEARAARRAYRLVGAVVAGTTLLVVLVTAGLVHFGPVLPHITREGPPALLANLVTLPLVLPSAYRYCRRRGSFERWVLVALTAFVADAAVTAMGGQPYTLGWLAGQVLGIIAASVLLVAMVGEMGLLYLNLSVAHQRLSLQSAEDVLTGALSRRALMGRIEMLVAQARYRQFRSALAIVDLDYLKQINDDHGHLMGDQVLAEVASRIRNGLREGDGFGRYGGDEFIVVMPETDYPDGRIIANRMLELIRSTPIRVGNHDLKVTATIGITGVEPRGDTVEAVLVRADAALYEAKARGRDQVVVCHSRETSGRRPIRPRSYVDNASSGRADSA